MIFFVSTRIFRLFSLFPLLSFVDLIFYNCYPDNWMMSFSESLRRLKWKRNLKICIVTGTFTSKYQNIFYIFSLFVCYGSGLSTLLETQNSDWFDWRPLTEKDRSITPRWGKATILKTAENSNWYLLRKNRKRWKNNILLHFFKEL